MDKHYALAREAILAALTAYTGITTEDGATPANNTLICADLIDSNDFITNKMILIGSGDAKFEDSGASSFVPGTGTITVASPFSHQIKKGTIFRVLNISSVEIDVATINTKIGTNTDPAGITTLFAWLANIFASGRLTSGLVYYGKVTQVDDATHFRVSGLTGFGDDYFANTYRVYVVRDAGGAGAAPQAEMQPCSDYDSANGIFTHTVFTAGLAVNDEILLLHERIAEIVDVPAIKTQTDKLAGETPVVGSATQNWQTAESNVISIGADDTKYKLHSLLLGIHNLVGTVITVRLYMQVNGVERRVYEQTFDATTDPPGLWIVNGTLGIHEVLRVTLQSNNAADNGQAVDYDYMLEAM